MSDGGKGSAPRKQRDDEAYSRNWETIFGKKRCGQTETSQTDSAKATSPKPAVGTKETKL